MGRWIIVDTDAGVDDAVALCLLFAQAKAQKIQLLVTTSFGNIGIKKVNINVAKTRRECGLDATDVVVAAGADRPRSGDAPIDATSFHGKDGMGDAVDVADIDIRSVENRIESSAHAAVRSFITRAHAEDTDAEVVVITIGPLTNLATWLDATSECVVPGLASKVHRVIIMGGCGNARGNVTRVAEFNVYADVDAAAEVFTWACQPSGPHVLVCPWELCVQCPVPWSDFDDIFYSPKTCGDFAGAILRLGYTSNREVDCKRGAGAVICDALAVAVALDPGMVKASTLVHVEVARGGRSYPEGHPDAGGNGDGGPQACHGQTVVDFGCCYDGIARQRHVTWVESVCVATYTQHLADVFCTK